VTRDEIINGHGLLPPVGETDRIDGARRYYATPEGTFPSVTTILDATMPQDKRAALAGWRRKVGDQEADRARDSAAKRGTRFHKVVEKYLLADPRPEPPHDLYFKSAANFIGRIERALLVEGEVWHDGVGYAGSLDLLAVVDGQITLIDWKTRNDPLPKVRAMGHMVQAAAYAAAVHRLWGVVVDRAMIVCPIPRKKAQEFSADRSALRAAWAEFRQRAATFHSGF